MIGLRAQIVLALAILGIFLAPLRLVGAAPDPGGGGTTNTMAWLDSWSFDDTNNWTTDFGYYPVSFQNISVASAGGTGNSLVVDSADPAWLVYSVYNYDGTTNLNVIGDGSVMFWMSPNWASSNDTNELGTGPGVYGRLLEIGNFTTNASYGWWGLYFDDVGNNLYFSAQDENGNSTNYFSVPVTFDSNVWHLIALSWCETNTSLYVDGECLTNAPGISVLPNDSVISSGFSIGSDSVTGVAQMHGAINEITTYGYALDPVTISSEWVLAGIFYWRNPDNLGNYTNAPYSPGVSDIYDVVSGPGFLAVVGTNTTTCFTNARVWITNASTFPGTNHSVNLRFMVSGGDPTLPYDVFATTALLKPITSNVWSWLGQAYPCETNVIYGLTNRAVYLKLGCPIDSDGDGLTDAWELLMTHTDPNNPNMAGDGISDGWKFLAGLPISSQVSPPTLNPTNCAICPVQ